MVIEPHVSDVLTLNWNDLFLICSDGLTDMLSHEQMQMILQENAALSDKADRLYRLAMEQGGKDNISVILLTVD